MSYSTDLTDEQWALLGPMWEHLAEQGVTDRLEIVLVDRGVTATAAHTLARQHDLELRRVGWDDKQPVFRPIRHAWRVEVDAGRRRDMAEDAP